MLHMMAAVATLAVLLSATASAKIVMYGDSFSDDGRGANPVVHDALSTDQIDVGVYPPAPYYKGRFSNGPTWIEIASAMLGQQLDNLATGNAATGSVPGAFVIEPYFGYVQQATMVPVPSSYQQSMAYADLHGGSLNPNDWFVIFIGANDLIYTVNGVQNATVPGIVQYINMTMTASYAAGARQFVVLDMPNLAGLPMLSPPYTAQQASTSGKNYLQTSVMQLNQQLAALTEQYPSTHPGATVLTYSIAELFSNVTTDPAMYGFMDVTNPTYQGPSFFTDITGEYNYTVANPDTHLFWDVVHPTKRFHNIFGMDFASRMGEQMSAV